MVFVDIFIYFLHFCIYLSLKNKKIFNKCYDTFKDDEAYVFHLLPSLKYTSTYYKDPTADCCNFSTLYFEIKIFLILFRLFLEFLKNFITVLRYVAPNCFVPFLGSFPTNSSFVSFYD